MPHSKHTNPNLKYVHDYYGIDFRKHPEKYKIGKGEQGVLMAEPYKSEILPHWRFRTPKIATRSALRIYMMFLTYLRQDDFVGADMARKFLMMGWTRARRYANHPSGRKYATDGIVITQATDHAVSDKAKSAEIFKRKYDKARLHSKYLRMKQQHQQRST